jgi:hypothetical protein
VFGVPRVFKYQVVCRVSIAKENVRKQEGQQSMGPKAIILSWALEIIKHIFIKMPRLLQQSLSMFLEPQSHGKIHE